VKAWDAQLQSTEIIADLACRLAELDGVEEDPHGDAGQEGEGELDLAHRAPLGVAARTYPAGGPGVGVDQTSAPSCPQACGRRAAVSIRPFGPWSASDPTARAMATARPGGGGRG
jgi:hypothetical protein